MPLGGFVVAGPDPADDEPGGELLAFLPRRERRVPGFGDFGVGDPLPELVVPDGLRVLDGRPGVLGTRAIAARMLEFTGTVTEKCAPFRRMVLITSEL